MSQEQLAFCALLTATVTEELGTLRSETRRLLERGG